MTYQAEKEGQVVNGIPHIKYKQAVSFSSWFLNRCQYVCMTSLKWLACSQKQPAIAHNTSNVYGLKLSMYEDGSMSGYSFALPLRLLESFCAHRSGNKIGRTGQTHHILILLDPTSCVDDILIKNALYSF